MITDDMTMAMARMWTDWTMGMIHPTDWNVMLIGVWDSQSQNWATWASIPLSRTSHGRRHRADASIPDTSRRGGTLTLPRKKDEVAWQARALIAQGGHDLSMRALPRGHEQSR